jgi:hypothetical protein
MTLVSKGLSFTSRRGRSVAHRLLVASSASLWVLPFDIGVWWCVLAVEDFLAFRINHSSSGFVPGLERDLAILFERGDLLLVQEVSVLVSVFDALFVVDDL